MPGRCQSVALITSVQCNGFVVDCSATSFARLQDVARVLRDVLEGLRALHTNNVCHGCVNLESFLVEEVDGQFRGRLGFYPFSNPVRLKLLFLV